jgi:hypothetical protein
MCIGGTIGSGTQKINLEPKLTRDLYFENSKKIIL